MDATDARFSGPRPAASGWTPNKVEDANSIAGNNSPHICHERVPVLSVGIHAFADID